MNLDSAYRFSGIPSLLVNVQMAFFLAAFLLPCLAKSQGMTADFYHQKPPGDSPVIFGRNVISDGLQNRDMAISPDGTEIFYTIQHRYGVVSVIMAARVNRGEWPEPVVAEFSGQFNDLEPAFSPDGTRLYFASNRPVQNGDSSNDYNIWYVTKERGQWVKPRNPGFPVNTEKNEFFPSLAKNGNLYFTRQMPGQGEDIVVCRFLDGKYLEAESLPGTISTEGDEFNAYVDPDERFIIFSGFRRPDGFGEADLYISRRGDTGAWEESENLGRRINSDGMDYCPFVSPDRKYLFYTSRRTAFILPLAQGTSVSELRKVLQDSGNGFDDIYWVALPVILR